MLKWIIYISAIAYSIRSAYKRIRLHFVFYFGKRTRKLLFNLVFRDVVSGEVFDGNSRIVLAVPDITNIYDHVSANIMAAFHTIYDNRLPSWLDFDIMSDRRFSLEKRHMSSCDALYKAVNKITRIEINEMRSSFNRIGDAYY